MFPKFQDIKINTITDDPEVSFNSILTSSKANYRLFLPVVWDKNYKHENISYKVVLKVKTIIVKDIFGNYEIIKSVTNAVFTNDYNIYVMEFIITSPTQELLNNYNELSSKMKNNNLGIKPIDPFFVSESLVDQRDFEEFIDKGIQYIKDVQTTLSNSNEKFIEYLDELHDEYEKNKNMIYSFFSKTEI